MIIPEGCRAIRESDMALVGDLKIPRDKGKLTEQCYCEHLKGDHEGIANHGPCQLCACKQYTWSNWLIITDK